MLDFYKYRVVFSTFDIEQYTAVIKVLKENEIYYVTNTKSNTHGKSGMGQFGKT